MLWREVDLDRGGVEISQKVIRVKGRGLVRAATKSSAGERVLKLPETCLDMRRARAAHGIREHEPIFCDALGGHRDPSNVRRELRNARSPVASRARRDLGIELAKARRGSGLTQRGTAAQLGWPRTRLGLVETGRVRVDPTDVVTLLDLYAVPAARRQAIVDLAKVAAAPVDADALSWITSHNFRNDGDHPRRGGPVRSADRRPVGHARPSMTQDVYMSRGTKNPGAAEAIERAMGTGREPKSGP